MRTRAATLVAVALVVTGLPSLQPGKAADPPGTTPVAVVLTTSEPQLLQFEPPSGPRTALVDDEYLLMSSLAVARHGTRMVAVESDMVPSVVTVRDISGRIVTRYDDLSDGSLYAPALSPSGDLVAYNNPNRSAAGTGVVIVRDMVNQRYQEIPSPGDGRLGEHEFVTEGLVLVKDVRPSKASTFRAVGLLGAPDRTVVGLTDTLASELSDFALDPSGARMVYVRTSGTSRSIEVVSVTVTATQVVFGPPTVLVSGSVAAPAFTRDASTVVYVGGAAPSRDLFSVPANGGAAALYGPATPLVDEAAVVFGVTEPTAPGAVRLGKALLGKPAYGPYGSASIPVKVPADPTLSGLRVTRTAPGEEPVERDTVLPAATIHDNGLVLGRTYTYAVQPFDRSGNTGPISTVQLVATAPPTMRTADPTSSTSVGSGFDVGLAPVGNAPDTRYTVDSRVQGREVWERLVTLTTASSVPSQGAPGQTYAFRGAAVDRFGNLTAPTPGVRAVVPFDQLQRATYTGSVSTASRDGAYGGTVTFLRTAGTSVTLRSAGDRLQLVGERCPSCGAFDVSLDGKLQARVDTGSSVRAVRQVLWSSPVQFTNRVRMMTVRAVGTPGRPGVVVDALSARRYGPDGSNVLLPGQQLRIGGRLVSTDGQRGREFDGNLELGRSYRPTPTGDRLVMQADGNLVIYAGTRAVWSSRTNGNPSSSLVQQPNGELIVYRGSDGRPLWTAAKGRLY